MSQTKTQDQPVKPYSHRASAEHRAHAANDAASAVALRFADQDIRERGVMISLTDMWKAAGSPDSRRPADWRDREGRAFVETVALTLNAAHSGIFSTSRGRTGQTFGHWQVALGYAQYLSPEFHMWCNTVVRERMEGALVTVSPIGLGADDRRAIGGIVKGVNRGLLNQALAELLPNLIAEAIAAHQYGVVRGLTAGDVLDLAGLTDRKGLRNLPRRVSDRLRQFHAERGRLVNRATLGQSKAYVFDPATSREWLAAGGKSQILAWAAEARGQGKFKLEIVKPQK